MTSQHGRRYPITDASRAIGSVIMLSGILTLAVPITLISNNFQDVWVRHHSPQISHWIAQARQVPRLTPCACR